MSRLNGPYHHSIKWDSIILTSSVYVTIYAAYVSLAPKDYLLLSIRKSTYKFQYST